MKTQTEKENLWERYFPELIKIKVLSQWRQYEKGRLRI